MRSLRNCIALDVRSLAALRIGLGLLLLVNVFDRAQFAAAHYSDHGVLPRYALPMIGLVEEWTAPPHWVSLHMLSGETWFQVLLFAIALVPACGVLVGYRTRLSLAASWVLLIGMQGRNPFLLNGGDDFFRCVLLWSLFLPLGATWSCDRQTSREPVPKTVASVGSLGLLLQIACMYWFTAVLKHHPVWRTEFSAVHYALRADHFTTEFGYWLANMPSLLTAMTCGAFVLELCGPTLLFVPLAHGFFRTLIGLSFIAFHFGLVLTMRIGMFPWTCMVVWLVVLPSSFWDAPLWSDLGRRIGFGNRVLHRGAALFRDVRCWSNPAAPTFRLGWLQSLLGLLLIQYMLTLNWVRRDGNVAAHLPSGVVRVLGDAAQLNQYWCMFSPAPPMHGGWFSFDGITTSGRRVNLLHPDEPVASTKPPLVSATYPNERWRKFLLVLIERFSEVHRWHLCRYLAQEWNATHEGADRVERVEIMHMAEPIANPAAKHLDNGPAERRLLYRWDG